MATRMPTHLLLGLLAGWVNRQHQAVIDYLQTENAMLRRQVKARPKLTDGSTLSIGGEVL